MAWMLTSLAACAFVLPGTAAASVTIGQTTGATDNCAVVTSAVQLSTSAGATYTAPSSGVVVTWKYLGGSDPTQPDIKFKVYDTTGSTDSWFLRSESAKKDPLGNQLNTYNESPGLPIHAGDVLGLTGLSGSGASHLGCITNGTTNADKIKTNGFGGADTTVGQNNTLDTEGPFVRLDVSAVIEPDGDDDHYGDETQDSCPANPAVHVGACAPSDDDADGVLNGTDNCQAVVNPDQANTDGDAQGNACDPDDDNDGVLDGADNCPLAGNANQANTDGIADGGDACDTDDDNDTVLDGSDNCPTVANANQVNADTDAEGDACDGDDDGDGAADGADNCPTFSSPDQTNTDGDGQGDVCDSDDDGDGVLDTTDACPLVSASTTNGCPAGMDPVPDPSFVLAGLKLDPNRFSARRGTTISYVLSLPATVTFRIARRTSGRVVGRACKATTKKNRNNKRCTRYLPVAGSITQSGLVGANRSRFTGRIGVKTLRPGRYRLTAIAKNAAGVAAPAVRATFRVL